MLIPVLCMKISLLEDELERVRENVERRLNTLSNMILDDMSPTLAEYLEGEKRNLHSLRGELDYVKNVMSVIKGRVCETKPSRASLIESKNIVEKLYLRYIVGRNRNLPGHIAPFLYEIYHLLRKLY